MKVFLLLIAVVALIASASAAPLFGEHQVHEEARGEADGWRPYNRADPNHAFEMHIFVKQENIDLLESTLYDVSDPKSANYGKHLSNEEVHQLVAPKAESVAAVLEWLSSHGISDKHISANPNSDIIAVMGVPVFLAEQMLNTHFYEFKHISGFSAVRSLRAYSLPAEIRKHVDFVSPSFRLPKVQTMRVPAMNLGGASTGAPEQGFVTPKFLREIYNVGSYTGSNKNNSQAITSFLNQFINLDDLQQFFSEYQPSQSGQNPKLVGPNDASNPGVEASLDIQYLMGVSTGIRTEVWSTAGQQPHDPENEPFLKWLFALSNTTSVPYVFSGSYADNEPQVNFPYAQRVNYEFMKAGVRGITLVFGSGDGGVSGAQPQFCSRFVATFPCASPYVVGVGGTTNSNPEVVAALSGGGFSDFWARPDYQKEAVAGYFQQSVSFPPAGAFNQTGAGFPDVAAQAEDYAIVVGGSDMPVSGTSAATPTFSAIVGMLNDVRLNAGKSSLGWLNPLIYQNPQAFNDITSGNNPGCDANGYEAAPGWDPITGFGTANFGKLSEIVSALQ